MSGGMEIAVMTPAWEFIFPIGPEAVKVSYGGAFAPWSSITQGLMKVPAGRQPQAVQFSVLLPAQVSLSQLYPEMQYQDESTFVATNDPSAGLPNDSVAGPPLVYVANLQQAIEENASEVYLLCAELRMGGVYLAESIEADHSGPFGDITLSCSFSEMRVPTVSTISSDGVTAVNAIVPFPYKALDDGNPKFGQPYTTKTNDTLATIGARAGFGVDSDVTVEWIWEWADNAAVITKAGGQEDGTLPVGITIKIPPAPKG